MAYIIFGEEPPKLNFRQKPDGSVSISIGNEYIIWYEGMKTLTWEDILTPGRPSYCKALARPYLIHDERQRLFCVLKKLKGMTETKAEKLFFEKYLEMVQYSPNSLRTPVLIPQVWVNWYHYDPKNKKRAEILKREPFRIDFLMIDEQISNQWVIIEIDGLSHFTTMHATPDGTTYKPDLEAYTVNLRRDRWLRKQGFKVFRFSDLEVENEFDVLVDEELGIQIAYDPKGNLCFYQASEEYNLPF